MAHLGFIRSKDYYDWCWANGFDGTTEKSKTDLAEETDVFNAASAKRASQNRLHKNPKAFFKAVCCGDLNSEEVDRPSYKRAAAEIESSNESEIIRLSLFEMLTALIKHEDLLLDTVAGRDNLAYITGLIKLHDRKSLWLQPLSVWKPKSKNTERKFGELTHHLFDKFGDVPRFMEAVWLRTDQASWRYRDWYIHLGRGHNLRTAKPPIPITKKMAHHFLSAPDDFTVEQALRWAQLKALGASVQAISAVCATRLARSFENEEFWFTVLRFIADNPMLDPRQIGPLVDYLYNQKYQGVEVEIAPGEWANEPPPNPGLTMAGRTVTALLRQIEAWHEGLTKMRGLSTTLYEQPSFEGFVSEKRTRSGALKWVIRQLRSAKDLQTESEELRHCVSSYHWSCSRNMCTIWSLSVSGNNISDTRRQTIEVNKGGTIVQCRGLANRDPKADEWAIVKAWAGAQNLQIAPYL